MDGFRPIKGPARYDALPEKYGKHGHRATRSPRNPLPAVAEAVAKDAATDAVKDAVTAAVKDVVKDRATDTGQAAAIAPRSSPRCVLPPPPLPPHGWPGRRVAGPCLRSDPNSRVHSCVMPPRRPGPAG